MTDRPEPGSAEWNDYLAEGNAKQARKRVTADALLRDTAGRLLLVRPTYKDGWDLPGGMAEANESPTDAVRRELREELGLNVQLNALLCVDWITPHGPWDDLLAFIFDGGTLTESQCARLRPQDEELSACAFFDEAKALEHLLDRQRLRTTQALAALKDRVPRYLENGNPTW
ncbi:NUDIX domain-containing protein [Streptosporangium canum]|uniref:NUDIX domain-containing protein n=1 Tax=Streptosporangium canum TaxID=324952 RepID=UPI003790B016